MSEVELKSGELDLKGKSTIEILAQIDLFNGVPYTHLLSNGRYRVMPTCGGSSISASRSSTRPRPRSSRRARPATSST